MVRILREGQFSEDRKEKFQRYLEIVETETRRCSQIVSGLLSFSRQSQPSFGHVHLDELVQRCILLSQHKLELSNIRLESNIQSNLPSVDGDFNQLQQCVINLIFNAIDAMPDGGTLSLNVHGDTARKAVIVTLQDTGRGIASEDLPLIFEPFFTTKSEGYGVGLGLSTVYGIVEQHKGVIHVESHPGVGSTFMIELPVSRLSEDDSGQAPKI